MSNIVEILEERVLELKRKSSFIETKLNLNLNKISYQLLSYLIADDIVILSTRDGIYFHALREDNNYSREIFSLNIRKDWKTGKVTEINPSVYSTSENNEFELKRLMTIGNVASFLLDGGTKKLQETWECIVEEWDNKIKGFDKERWELEGEIKILNQMKKDVAKQKRLSLLKNKGLKFDYSELDGRHNMPTLGLKYNDYINSVIELQVARESGKSVDIRVVTQSQRFDQETKEYTTINDQPRIYQRVKLSNVEAFINSAKEYIVK